MTTLQQGFPDGSHFRRSDGGDLLLIVPDELIPGRSRTWSIQEWVDRHTIEGTSYEVVETVGGEVVAVVLSPPGGGISAGPVAARRFRLVRYEDVSGISGTGVVAHGVEWPDGTVSMRWAVPGLPPSFANWETGVEAVQAVHGHHGKTEIEWID